MATPKAGLTAEHGEMLFNLKHNGVLTCMDAREAALRRPLPVGTALAVR